MTLQERIKADLTTAMKEKDSERKDALRVVLGELGRLPAKDLSDEDVLQVIKKLIKSEREVLQRKGGSAHSAYLKILETYLPVMASAEEIAEWIKTNIDLTAYKSKMQAMGDIMRHFGGRADGNMVKTILQRMP